MATVDDAYSAIANLNLWLKTRTGDRLMLADLPEIIPLRWPDFRDNWEFIKPLVLKNAPNYLDPDFLNQQVIDFSSFIDSQRENSKNINPFSDGIIFHKFYAVFDNITVSSVNLTNEERRLVSVKVAEVKQYSKNDFLKIKQTLLDYRDRSTDIVGLTDDAYNTAFGRSPISSQLSATITDLNMLLIIQNGIKAADFILANLFAVDAFVDPFALARANANNPNISIGQYASGRLVKLNYGEDLQSLATRYLGDPNKWIDIAIANGLKPPYIDEVGQAISLLSNGDGSQINIAEIDDAGELNIDKFFINQAVFLQSSTQVFPEQRTIISINQIPVSGEIILGLDGDPDLNRYKVSESATVRVYKPNTVNSSFFVLIPSPNPLPDTRRDEVPWFLAKSAEDEKRAKIDLAVDENGELGFTTNGDLRLSFGLENAVQAVKLKLMTELGSLRYHPGYGLANIMGNKTNDLDSARALLTESIQNQIEIDPRFDRIEHLGIDFVSSDQTTNGVAVFAINLAVRLSGGQNVIPISFTVNF